MTTRPQTWDQALARQLRGGIHRRWRRGVLAALAVGLLVGLLPAVAQAHEWEAPGLNGAQLWLNPDGYEGNGGLINFLGLGASDLHGKNFMPNDVAKIYLCEAGETDLSTQCQLLGLAPTALDGTFRATTAGWQTSITKPDGSKTQCVGPAGSGVQCAVAAATFEGTSDEPSAMAEHYVCFFYGEQASGCKPGPADPAPETPPNGVNGEKLVLSKDRDLQRDRDVIQVSGTGFVPTEVAEIFKCPALAGSPRAECTPIGSAPTDSNGSFGPVPVVFNGIRPGCAGLAALQCSVVAATFVGPTDNNTTSRAEHYVCVAGTSYPCSPGDPTSPTTTTTLAPEWQPAASMNVARQGLATAAGTDGRIYAMGGHDPIGNPIKSAEVLDPCGAKTWSLLADMPTARTELAVAGGPDGRIYAIGGRDERSGTPLATVEAYDPDTNEWSQVARLAVPRADLAAATGSDGRIYAIGGTSGGGTTPSIGVPVPTVEAYDPVDDQWQVVTPLSRPRSDLGATTGLDGRIYAVGGRSYAGAAFSQGPAAESYSPGPDGAPGVWIPALSGEMFPGLPPEMAVTTGPDGLIYATGGVVTSNTEAVRIWRTYEPARDIWKVSAEAMLSRRTNHGAATGLDGRVYAIGGTDDPLVVDDPNLEGPQSLASVESLRVGPNTCPTGLLPADFDGSRTTDYSVFRPSTGTWFVKGGLTLNYGTEGDIPVPADYDGDRKADVAVFRPSSGVWFVRNSTGGDTALAYGTSGDIPVPADYDGDEKTDMAVFRPSSGVWFIKYSAGGDAAAAWGTAGDVPVPTDYDGDKKADVAVFRSGTWFIRPASGAPDITVNYGTSGDIPVPGDYDADNAADIAVFRPSNGFWFLRHSSDGTQEAFHFGTSGDVPVPGDYNGDTIADPAVFRPSSGVWFVETGATAAWGTSSDIPLPLPAAVRMAYFPGA